MGAIQTRMLMAERAARIQAELDRRYPEPPIPLAHDSPFTLLVAVVLSAQTTDARVNLVTPALFARARTPAAMARLGVSEIHALIRTCGLAPAKAKNLHALSQLLLERHAGEVPATFEALEALPGVGHKTASVVMSQAFGQPAFAVDTHIHRLAARWRLSKGQSVVHTERDLKRIFDEQHWNRLHLQMIYFGREHCPAQRHVPAQCPICCWAAPRSRTAPAQARPRREHRASPVSPLSLGRRAFEIGSLVRYKPQQQPEGKMGTLRDKLNDNATRQRVIDDAIKVIDAEVSDKGGLGGMAIKAAYMMVKGIAPGIMQKLLNGLLPDFLDAIQPYADKAAQSGTDLKQYVMQQPSAVANALLAVTDGRAAKADAGALKKGYEKLRPTAQKHVEQALPRLSDLIKSFA